MLSYCQSIQACFFHIWYLLHVISKSKERKDITRHIGGSLCNSCKLPFDNECKPDLSFGGFGFRGFASPCLDGGIFPPGLQFGETYSGQLWPASGNQCTGVSLVAPLGFSQLPIVPVRSRCMLTLRPSAPKVAAGLGEGPHDTLALIWLCLIQSAIALGVGSQKCRGRVYAVVSILKSGACEPTSFCCSFHRSGTAKKKDEFDNQTLFKRSLTDWISPFVGRRIAPSIGWSSIDNDQRQSSPR